ncbi:uncharacterized protein LOC126386122 [Epinephelus moara]|uniref:uncharacterized protein LOC126386122 n=1 Tax=Epinephelus moara TaxID=300413 RepID=UPI00214E3D27|nr:uncharacterized protein LOC126386122 [Epinephelus moara]
MKTLCVAVVLLSLTSVGQPATLACEKLLKPDDRSPDLTGRWYFIAVSMDSCMITTLLNAVFWPSLAVDITSKDTPKLFDAKFTVKMYGYCESESDQFWYDNHTLLDIDSNNLPTGKPDQLVQTSCPDCIIIKTEDDQILSAFLLLSRRKTVTTDELKEFEAQVKCMSWFKPQVLNTDHEYQNCPSLETAEDDSSRLSKMIYARLKTTYTEPLQCLAETLMYYPKTAYEWAQESWASLW